MVDDRRIGSSTAGDDEINGHDICGPQIDMKMSGQPRAGAEKDGMNEVDGIGVIAKQGEFQLIVRIRSVSGSQKRPSVGYVCDGVWV